MRTRLSGLTQPWLCLAVIMTVLKLWLTAAQPIFALAWASHDDRLFLQLAEYLCQGEWLGPYNQMTLAKGPFYSMWAAVASSIGIPLFISQHLLYAAACALVVRALRPALPSAAGAFALYALLLWNPMTFDASSLGRVLRQHVYVPLGLMIFAGLSALSYRCEEKWKRQLPWALLLGQSFAAFHLTREETPWIFPGVALLAGGILVGAARVSRQHLQRSALMLAVAATAAIVPVLLVSALNARHYGWFGTVEFRASAFKDAYGAMTRVKIGDAVPSTPVPRAAREAIYPVSPAFATLRPHLEGPIGLGWAEASTGVTGRPADEREIGGGWLMWALRDAVAAAGHAGSASEALAFYRRMADEINAACDDGRLSAGPQRSGFMPVLRASQIPAVASTFFMFGDYVIRFGGFNARPPPSEGDEETFLLFRDLTGGRLSPVATEIHVETPWERARIEVLQRLGAVFHPLGYGLFWVALIAGAVRLVSMACARTWSFPLTLAFAAGGSAAMYLGIQAVIHVTSFPVMVISSFASAYPFVLLFIGAIGVEVVPAWAPRVRKWIAARIPSPLCAVRPEAAPEPDSPWRRRLPWIGALLAALPYLLHREAFDSLVWFADDLFLVDQLAHMGFSKWTFAFFTESFVPLFKVFWGGVLLFFDGSYAAMIRALWVTHALNTYLLGRLLAKSGFSLGAVVLVQVVFALTPANQESLGWSVQWSASLAVTCLLAGLKWIEGRNSGDGRWQWGTHLPPVVFAAAGAVCFARGVLTGGVFACALLLPLFMTRDWLTWRKRFLPAAVCLLPSFAVAAGIVLFAHGNQRSMDGHWGSAVEFGLTYFLYNPLYLLLGEPTPYTVPYYALAVLKLLLVGGGLAAARGRTRALLAVLLVYDLGNAVLLGIGRHHTGLYGALGQRYGYSAFISTLPLAGVLFGHTLNRLIRTPSRQVVIVAATCVVLAVFFVRAWTQPLGEFAAWRGVEMRALLAAPYTTDPSATVPALDFMHLERAKALQRAYNLH